MACYLEGIWMVWRPLDDPLELLDENVARQATLLSWFWNRCLNKMEKTSHNS